MLLVNSEHTNRRIGLDRAVAHYTVFSFWSLRTVTFVKGSIRIIMLIIQTKGMLLSYKVLIEQKQVKLEVEIKANYQICSSVNIIRE